MAELRIKEICKAKGLSMADVAERLGMDTSNLYSSLKGNPSLKRLQEIADALNVNIGQLFAGNEPDLFTGVITMNGGTYKIAKATEDVVCPPVYTDYSVFRRDLKEFIERSVKEEKPSSFMGMLETFEIFNVVYSPENNTYYLTLCYGTGRTITNSYDRINDYGDGVGNTDWDMLFLELRNDIEHYVPTIIQRNREAAKSNK